MSPTALSGIAGALIDGSGGNKKALVLSPHSTLNYRLEATKSITEEIKENWIPPAKGVIHWDGKLMQTLDSFGKEERLPTLLSGKFSYVTENPPLIKNTI